MHVLLQAAGVVEGVSLGRSPCRREAPWQKLGQLLRLQGWVPGGSQRGGVCCWAALQPSTPEQGGFHPQDGWWRASGARAFASSQRWAHRALGSGLRALPGSSQGSAAARYRRSFLEDVEECGELVGTDKIKL